MKPEWHLIASDTDIVNTLIADLQCHPVIAAILANRAILSKEDALAFFSPSLSTIRHPFALKDMGIATDRIFHALNTKQRILIFGDYDADGITSTVILFEFLQSIGADVSFYIPHRVKEGYGLKANHISQVAIARNIDLIITVDCGSDSYDAVASANQNGIDVIITDHHTISPQMPSALAVINPKRQDCSSGLSHLAGVGVVFYLLMGLRKQLRENGFFKDITEPNLKQYCDLVALGTVADIVPMVDENRTFTRVGLGIMSEGKRLGLKTLMESANINSGHVDTDGIAFRLAPRLNAAGRMGHAVTSINLLTAGQPQQAAEITEMLNQYNSERKIIEDKTLRDILMILKRNPEILDQNSIILHDKNWHEGILGIVASRLVRKFTKPVVLVTSQNGMARGSARSIPGFDLYEGLRRCENILEGYGGHTMAAGLSIKTDSIPDFMAQFESAVGELTRPDDFIPNISVDYELPFGLITEKLLDEMETMQPFGKENPEPLFLSSQVKVVQSHIMGQNHRRMTLKQDFDNSNAIFSAIQFNVDPRTPNIEYFEHILYRLRYNRWNGKKSIQFIIEDATLPPDPTNS